ncbi:MAG: class I SAM-dependent methyltransferase [Pseudomonadota bacterium]
MSGTLEQSVASHYAQRGLGKRSIEALEASGANLGALTIADLAPVDEFHTAGRLSTLKALELASIRPGMHVLDAGCGIGGTARCLASEYGCQVTGVDLTVPYVEVARMLTGRLGLEAHCVFHHGNVTALGFGDDCFDAAVSFHVAMNIENRAAFYAEMARLIRVEGPLVLFDVMKGPTAGMRYPVPWAQTEATSFLRTPTQTQELLEAAGFAVETTHSLRDLAMDYFDNLASQDAPPAQVGLHLLTGDDTEQKFSNYVESLHEHQIDPVIVVARRR